MLTLLILRSCRCLDAALGSHDVHDVAGCAKSESVDSLHETQAKIVTLGLNITIHSHSLT